MDWREHCGDKLVSSQQAIKNAVRNGDAVQLNWLHATPLTLSHALMDCRIHKDWRRRSIFSMRAPPQSPTSQAIRLQRSGQKKWLKD